MYDKLRKLINSLLPGLYLFGFTLGTGSVTAMANAGADYGMALLWAIFLSCLITFIMIQLYGKFALVSGETALSAFRKHIHPAVGIFFIITLTAHVCGSIIGVMGIISDLSYEWSKAYFDNGIQPIYFAVFFIFLVYGIFLQGNTQFFKQVLAVIVAIMAICFLINFIIFMPSIDEIARGFIPVVPETQPGQNPYLLIASIVGTTVFSGLFILRTTLVKEAGWTFKDLRIQRRDAMFAAFMMFVVSASVMAAAAGTLHVHGTRLDEASQMVTLLEPLIGLLAVSIFTLGMIAAGVSSQFPNVTLTPYLIDDYKNVKPNMRQWKYRIIVLVLSLLGLLVPLLQAPPVAVMVTSQAFGALILPVTVACLIFLGNKKNLMREHTFSWVTNIVLFLIFIFAVIMSYMSYSGLFETISRLFA